MGINFLEALRRAVRALYAKIPTGLKVVNNQLFLTHNDNAIGKGIAYPKPVGIETIEWTNDYRLNIKLDNGSGVGSPVLRGENGVGIRDIGESPIVQAPDGNEIGKQIIIVLTDGRRYTFDIMHGNSSVE